MALEKARRAVVDALNGDSDKVDPALRRALIALAAHIDEHSEASAQEHAEIRDQLTRINKLLIATSTTFVAALIAAMVNLVFN